MKWYRNINIKYKFALIFKLIIILTCLLGFLSMGTIFNIISTHKKNIEYNKNFTKNIINIINDISEIQIYTNNIIQAINEQNAENIKNEFYILYNTFKTDANNYLEIYKTYKQDEDTQTLDSIINSIEDYYASFLKAIDLIILGNSFEFNTEADNLLAQSENLLAQVNALYLDTLESVDSYTDRFILNIYLILGILLFIMVITLIIIIFANKIFDNTVTIPLFSLKEASSRLAKGDFNILARSNSRDEIGEISNSIGDIAQNFGYIFEEINILKQNFEKGNISFKINEDRYSGVFKDIVSSINITNDIIISDYLYITEIIKEFGDGKINKQIRQFIGEKEIINKSILAIQKEVLSLDIDIDRFIKNINKGNLAYRIDTSKYLGIWQKITNNLNIFIKDFAENIKTIENALVAFDKSDFSYIIDIKEGAFYNISDMLNCVAENIDYYIKDICIMLDKIADKDFNFFIKEYDGDFNNIANHLAIMSNNLNIFAKYVLNSSEDFLSLIKQMTSVNILLQKSAADKTKQLKQFNLVISDIYEKALYNFNSVEKVKTLILDTKDNINNLNIYIDTYKTGESFIKFDNYKMDIKNTNFENMQKDLYNITSKFEEILSFIQSIELNEQKQLTEKIVDAFNKISSLSNLNTDASKELSKVLKKLTEQTDLFYKTALQFKFK